MPKDLKGIHQYVETDNQPKFSELMNLGMQSVSDTLKYFSDTSAKRLALTPAPDGAIWQDTDNNGKVWSTAPDGSWRLHEGRIVYPAGAWTTLSAGIYYRLQNITVPTVLAPNETLAIAHEFTSQFSFVTLGSLTRNPANTSAQLRLMQLGNATEGTGGVTWRVVKGAN